MQQPHFTNRILLEPNASADGGSSNLDGLAPIDITGKLAQGNDAQPATPATTEGEGSSEPKILDASVFNEDLATPPTPATAAKPVEKPDYSAPVDTSKKAEPVVKPVVAEPTKQELPTTTQALPPKRDYTGFDEKEVEIFKKMPNDVFAKFSTWRNEVAEREKSIATVQEENRKLKSGAPPDSYYAHKEAYTITPEYQTAVGKYQQAQKEQGVFNALWKEFKGGAKTLQWPKQWKADGTLETYPISVDETNSADLEGTLIDARNNVVTLQQSAIAEIRGIQTNWSQRHETLVNAVKAAEAQYFPFYEKLDETKPEGQLAKRAMDEVAKMVAPELRSYPLHNMFLKSAATNILLSNKLGEVMKELETLRGRKVDATKAGPSASETTAATTGSQTKMLSTEAWEK